MTGRHRASPADHRPVREHIDQRFSIRARRAIISGSGEQQRQKQRADLLSASPIPAARAICVMVTATPCPTTSGSAARTIILRRSSGSMAGARPFVLVWDIPPVFGVNPHSVKRITFDASIITPGTWPLKCLFFPVGRFAAIPAQHDQASDAALMASSNPAAASFSVRRS